MPHDRFRSTNSRSVVEYVPRTELDYGSLLCWATNSIGRQREPCIFHLVPGKSELVEKFTYFRID